MRIRPTIAALLAATTLSACHDATRRDVRRETPMSQDEVIAVQNRHNDELMAIPGVVGVYVGSCDDPADPKRLCIRVLVLKDHPEAKAKIPGTLEGIKVITEESDPIRPLGGGG